MYLVIFQAENMLNLYLNVNEYLSKRYVLKERKCTSISIKS